MPAVWGSGREEGRDIRVDWGALKAAEDLKFPGAAPVQRAAQLGEPRGLRGHMTWEVTGPHAHT